MADQQLRTPRWLAGAAFEQRDQSLAPVEGAVDRGQVGDLERDDHDPDGADRDVDAGLRSTSDVDRPHREEGGQRLEQPIGEVMRCSYQHQPESEHEGRGPEQQLSE